MLSVDFSKVTSRKEVDDLVSEKIKLVRIRQFVLKNLYHINNTRFGWRINIRAISDNLENVFEAVDSPYPFEKPSLFIKAGLSDYVPDEDKKPIMKLFPKAGFETIEGASHWVHAEKPDELIRVISEYIR
jgi:pimeloyl-ACP methyl ester carboxylesterase